MRLVALTAPATNEFLVSSTNALLTTATRPVELESGHVFTVTNKGIAALVNDEHFRACCCNAKEVVVIIAIALSVPSARRTLFAALAYSDFHLRCQ